MTPTSKEARRAEWKKLNFAGTIDWAVDLQRFGEEDKAVPTDLPSPGEEGPLPPFPPEKKGVNISNIIAWDDEDVELNQLCKFGCKYGVCPGDVCTTPIVDLDPGDDPGDAMNDPNYVDTGDTRYSNRMGCVLSQDPREWGRSIAACKSVCAPYIAEAEAENRTTNYGCVVWQPKGAPDPYHTITGLPGKWANGECNCDNVVINEIADTVIEAMPAIAQTACYIVMSSFKLVLDIGTTIATGGTGRVLTAGLDLLLTAAEMASYIYPETEDPEGAFSWWLSPCGGTDLVPDEVKEVFDILNSIADGISSFKKPKNIPKGSGRKGDSGNPNDQTTPRAPGPNRGPKPKCEIATSKKSQRLYAGRNVLRILECVKDETKTTEYIITSIISAQNAVATQVQHQCKAAWKQACYHYSSAIRVNPQWAVLTCPPEAATTAKLRTVDSPALHKWENEHNGAGWKIKNCDRDEFPPAYFLNDQMPEWYLGGQDKRGQLVRYIPNRQNQDAGNGMFKRVCFNGPVKALSDRDFKDKVVRAPAHLTSVVVVNKVKTRTLAAVTVDEWPEFAITAWDHAANPPVDDGLSDNPCWPKAYAPTDPGFALLKIDPWYQAHPNALKWKYDEDYVQGTNGD
ncbi:hypothetical protein CHGG_06361 [Chaetomium globosum CBS 148.51]|uniref:Uncharacterized protein n=1 Tax=Chaetomium globosum (strain ATCC 6205 / CBS 148.51 / DSM 1962 / NBRC 6347 / NRRL 1970) TaxID=306901 RepID=Q2H4Q4_CHAGB|nr:uncharacterized protein CHGG_06361 [Chaetomium globosum CBS 148.51]EAQ89742.1 hypothetical protein CHGG_06361 [Chaetomium globosum CBS 148.51]